MAKFTSTFSQTHRLYARTKVFQIYILKSSTLCAVSLELQPVWIEMSCNRTVLISYFVTILRNAWCCLGFIVRPLHKANVSHAAWKQQANPLTMRSFIDTAQITAVILSCWGLNHWYPDGNWELFECFWEGTERWKKASNARVEVHHHALRINTRQ